MCTARQGHRPPCAPCPEAVVVLNLMCAPAPPAPPLAQELFDMLKGVMPQQEEAVAQAVAKSELPMHLIALASLELAEKEAHNVRARDAAAHAFATLRPRRLNTSRAAVVIAHVSAWPSASLRRCARRRNAFGLPPSRRRRSASQP